MSEEIYEKLADIANVLRIHSVESTTAAGSGHPSSCASIAEIMSVLFFHEMRYEPNEPKNPANDRFILSKGHAAPILYAAWAEVGLFPVEKLLELRKIDSNLEGHPTPRLNFVDVATGSLGQGLSCAAGMAWVGKYFDKAPYRVYCVLGDGECAEGSVWEAFNFAAHYKLDNLVAIIDVNRLGQSEPTMFQHHMDSYKSKTEAFGWHSICINGHCVKSLCCAFEEASNIKDKPTCIIAQTFKGKNLIGIENKENWHGKALSVEEAKKCVEHLKSLIKLSDFNVKPPKPEFQLAPATLETITISEPPNYKINEKVATRVAYGTALAKLAKSNSKVIALDGDTKNSTYAIKLKEVFPDRFIEGFIAEQNIAGVAVGASCRNRTIPFMSAFACFLTRACDQIRMAGISGANVKFCGSHCGCSIGEDGGSQMGLEDLAMFRSIPDSVVLYPSDAVSTERAVELAANHNGICYIRTTRPNTAVIYNGSEQFQIGKAKVVMHSAGDLCTVIGGGITLQSALQAAKSLKDAGKPIRVIDLFSVKPIDAETIIKNATETHGRIIVVEDHYPEGGMGEAVLSAVALTPNIEVHKLAVEKLPRSGPSKDLVHMFNIDKDAIERLVQTFA